MERTKTEHPRREFLKKCGLTAVPFVLPAVDWSAIAGGTQPARTIDSPKVVNFIFDGLSLSPSQYLEKLQEINTASPIEPDFYGNGGATKALEASFAKITGKEKAIYLPSGTMANQLAIKLLSGGNTKIIVPENSHVFRDEADAAQSVHGKRLIPIGKEKAYYNLSDLKNAIAYTTNNEVFQSGLDTVVIESPVRRADGTFVPLKTVEAISNYCKERDYKLHLDGARIHIAAAFHDVSIAEYASYFDTVYISLYKYLNASGGAILCGDAQIIDQMAHQIKILGGAVFQSWNQTAVALHYLNGIDERWREVVTVSKKLIQDLNKIKGVRITSIHEGTNIFDLTLDEGISLKKLAVYLYETHSIWLGRANEKGIVKFTVNESILSRDYDAILKAWQSGIEQARS
ncbi:MAG: DegT/DnrJ/EryC1/StrS family aminotransferase [Flavobacteriaceae bacterium]|nr:DegT/DnrJ/EryC1/StrS family aminotransferase [Flavobacteriaceae bacterium]